MVRLRTATLLILMACTAQAAMTYRTVVTTRNRFKSSPVVQRITADGNQRRLTVEHPEEPFSYDVLLSGDGGASVTALNSQLHTWYTLAKPSVRLSPSIHIEIVGRTTELREESGAEPIGAFPVRKFVVQASYTSLEDYGGTKVNRVHTLTAMIWTTDKLARALAFPPLTITMGEDSIDADLRQKTATLPGFPIRVITTVARAYDGGQPTVEMKSEEVDEVATIPAPPASLFVRPANYINQEPIIGGFAKR